MATENESKQLPLRLPVADYDALKTLAFLGDTSMNAIITSLVHAWLESSGADATVATATKRFRKDHKLALDKLAHI